MKIGSNDVLTTSHSFFWTLSCIDYLTDLNIFLQKFQIGVQFYPKFLSVPQGELRIPKSNFLFKVSLLVLFF